MRMRSKWRGTGVLLVLALASVLSTTACVGQADETGAAEVTDTSQQALSGRGTSPISSMNGMVRIFGASSNVGDFQGALVSPTMVLTARRAVNFSRRPFALTVESRPSSQNVRSTATVIDRIDMPMHDLVLLRLSNALADIPVTIDTRPATAPLQVRCNQFRADGTFRGALFNLSAIPNNNLMLLNGSAIDVVIDTANDGDYGLTCGEAGRVKGLLTYAEPPRANTAPFGLVADISRLTDFLAAQPAVFAVREDPLVRPFSLFVTENGLQKCLHVDATSVTTRDCDSRQKEQEFYFDRRVRATGASGDAIFSAQTARCLTALGPVLNASLPVTSAPCNQTLAQTFDLRFTANGHAHYVQAASGRCLTKSGASLTATRDCSELASKNWWISWH